MYDHDLMYAEERDRLLFGLEREREKERERGLKYDYHDLKFGQWGSQEITFCVFPLNCMPMGRTSDSMKVQT